MKKIEYSNIKTEGERINNLLDKMTLFDDDLMSRVFDKNIQATQLILRIILQKDIKVISAKGQEEFKNPIVGGRNIRLDVHAIDENGHEIDIEVQCNSEGANVRRARFHSSVTDSRMLKEKQKFKELKDSYIIFIYKHDKFRKGLPVYHVDRYIGETGQLFGDGSHIIYVNGSYKGNDDIGRLMNDFNQPDSENIYYRELAEGVRHYKETEGGRIEMCDLVKEYAEEYAEKKAAEAEKRGILSMIFTYVQRGKSTIEEGAKDADMSQSEFIKAMTAAGYKLPEGTKK